MAIVKENLTTLFERIAGFEESAKEQRGLIKEAFQLFAEQNNVNIKSIKKGYKEYKELQKDKTTFEVVDAEVTQMVNLLTEEVTVTE